MNSVLVNRFESLSIHRRTRCSVNKQKPSVLDIRWGKMEKQTKQAQYPKPVMVGHLDNAVSSPPLHLSYIHNQRQQHPFSDCISFNSFYIRLDDGILRIS